MFRKLLLSTLFAIGLVSPALAQNTTCSDRATSDSSNACANTRFVHGAISSIPTPFPIDPSKIVLGDGQVIIGNGSGVGQARTISGNCTLTDTGVITCTAINGIPVTNVQSYGAVGNGTTDDTIAIQNACAAVPNGGQLYFPPLNYKVQEIVCRPLGSITVTATGATLTNTTQTYNAAGGHNTPILRIWTPNSSYNVTVNGLTINGPRLSSSTTVGQGTYGGNPASPGPGFPSGLDIPYGNVVIVNNTTITGTYFAGLEIHYSFRTLTLNNTITNHGYAGILVSDSLQNYVGYNYVSDIGSIAPNDGYGITMSTSYNSPAYTTYNGWSSIYHNNVTLVKRKSIDVHNGLWGTIHDNYASGAAYAFIEVVCEGLDKQVQDWDIHDNQLYGNASFGSGTTASAGISVGSYSGVSAVTHKTNFRIRGNHLGGVIAPFGIIATNNDTVNRESISISIVGNTMVESQFSSAAVGTSNYSQFFDYVIVANNIFSAVVTNAHITLNNIISAISSGNSCNGTSGSTVCTTISGVSYFTQYGNFTNNSPDPANFGSIRSVSLTGGIGYASGSGSSVTQATSRTTGVTINSVSGDIVMFAAAGSATPATFTVTNSAVGLTDTIILSPRNAYNKYNMFVTNVAAGSFDITFYTTGGVVSDTPAIHFNIIKGVSN